MKNGTAISRFLALVGNIVKYILIVALQEVLLICGIQLVDISGSALLAILGLSFHQTNLVSRSYTVS